ncbi:hypothetical protein [Azotobacter chroococcum]|jgi:hypothetical protein|uniref:Uncharacterized protein n=1 Tax=Azotobacter chroococcum TaxID=353 RepID=A0AAP9YC82_9GAMM|nr:hypothetical protein [Azotobacter chroococcum]QQE88595.1 hypothetical protein GKQ51_20600 [Azotobacter chroococcum]
MAIGLLGKMLAETIHVNDFFIFAERSGSAGHGLGFQSFPEKGFPIW